MNGCGGLRYLAGAVMMMWSASAVDAQAPARAEGRAPGVGTMMATIASGEAVEHAASRAAPRTIRDELDEVFREATAWGFAGTVLVVQGGEMILHAGYGEADRATGVRNKSTTMFDIGSMPEEFTRAAVWLLIQDGALALSDPLSRFYPDAPTDKVAITIGDLLEGRSGLPPSLRTSKDANGTLTRIGRETAEARILAAATGVASGSPSRTDFVLLAAIVERVSGEPFQRFVSDRILMPAGMTRTGFWGDSRGYSRTDFAVGHGGRSVGEPNIPPNWGSPSWLLMGSAGMYSTPWDMHRFVTALKAGHVLRGEAREGFLAARTRLADSEFGFLFLHASDGSDSMLFLSQNAACKTEQSRELHARVAALMHSRLPALP